MDKNETPVQDALCACLMALHNYHVQPSLGHSAQVKQCLVVLKEVMQADAVLLWLPGDVKVTVEKT